MKTSFVACFPLGLARRWMSFPKSRSFVIVYMMLISGLFTGCEPNKPTEQQLSDHKKEVDTWFDNRIVELKSHDGWLNLAGLFWLKEGMNSFGSDERNDLVFPAGKIADNAGFFVVKGQTVSMISSDKSVVEKETVIFHPDSAKAPTFNHGSLEWFVIRRDDKVGIRLRDLESEAVKDFEGIDRYPVEYSWKLPARFEPSNDGETIDITNVLGQTTSERLAGRFVFSIDGTEYKLAATGSGKSLFIVFGDATNGNGTYPAGRFVYADRPDSTGVSYVDFNKSYNPPCAFTDFATCPLPPKQNVLPVAITSGEKNYDLHHK